MVRSRLLRRGTLTGVGIALLFAACAVDLDYLKNHQCGAGLQFCNGHCLKTCQDGGQPGGGGVAVADGAPDQAAGAGDSDGSDGSAGATGGSPSPGDASSVLDGARRDGSLADAAADARRDAADDGDVAAPIVHCPTDLPGPPMVPVSSGTTALCIDSTEVTVAQYAAFLAGRGTQTDEPPHCAGHNYDRTDVSCFDASQTDLPVDRVDWCDAYMYCKWANKRLCGSTAGGTGSFSAGNVDQWVLACANGVNANVSAYPYGTTYSPTACNVHQGHLDALTCSNGLRITDYRTAVGSKPDCKTPGGAFDMVGNSWEWVDACGTDILGNPQCLQRGGSWVDSGASGPSVYNCLAGRQRDMFETGLDISFRCCYDVH